jgi:predicted RNA methylase
VNLSLFSFQDNTITPNAEIAQTVKAIEETIAVETQRKTTKRDNLIAAAADFMQRFANGLKTTWDVAVEIMSEHFGGSDAEGAWVAQDAYNAIEAGLVRAIAANGISRDTLTAISELEALDELLPNRRRRSDDGILLQQYSTPSPYGLIAARAAQISASDVVLEPTAGTGMLAVFARLAGATVLLNEIDGDRLALVRHLTDAVPTDHDARYLSALYKGEKPTVVVMNPPFSIDHNLGADRRVRALALSHIDQAIRLLRRGGRLVAIVGSKQSPAEHPELWDDIAVRATVRAAIAVDGNTYKSMGTTFGTALVVLDAVIDDQKPLLYRSPVDIREAFALIEKIAPRAALTAERASHGGGRTNGLTLVGTRNDIVADFAFKETPQPVIYRARTEIERTDSEGRYASYRPQSIVIEGAKPHPTDLVESQALACVRPPMPTYVPMLPPSAIASGALSEAQLELVVYAGEAFSKTLELIEEDEEHRRSSTIVRRAFMSGYGTGFGKGNGNAGVIADAFAHGHMRALWLSESPTLIEDAKRDWKAITGDETAIFPLSNFPVDTKVERKHGIMFVPYATLRSKSKKTERSRVQQIIEWLGDGEPEEFSGVIVMDECHNLSNAVPARGDGTIKTLQSGSLQGMAALELQRALPKARVLYVSATSASKIDALAYAPRLGLWGIDTAFPNRAEFLSKMDAGGTAALELLCRDMKALGLYLSASLSYEGVTYERLVHHLDNDQIQQYNNIAGAWRMIHRATMEALKSSNASSLARAAALSIFEATKLRSIQQLIVSQKVPTIIEDIERQLAEGNCCVIQLTNTNEAIQERALAKLTEEEDLDSINLSGSEIILDFIDRSFPTTMYETYVTEDGNVASRPLEDKDGQPIANPEAIALREELKVDLASVLAPSGPLERIIDHFGPDAIAEVTGRSRRVVLRDVNGVTQRVIEERGNHANLAEMQAFRDGTKRILLFSEAAGGTGFSYHADRSAINQARRIHYLLQTGYRSDRALQGMGRTHRTNQSSAPHYVLVVTDVPGEMRFISVIARRLESLGALTRGQRDAASGGVFNASDNLESHWAQLAVTSLLTNISSGLMEHFPNSLWEQQTCLKLTKDDGGTKAEQISVSRFLNRVLACDLGPNGGYQGVLMEALLEQLEHVVEQAKKAGTFDRGIQTIKAIALRKLNQQVVHTHEDSGATTSIVELEAELPREVRTFHQTLSMLTRIREKRGSASAFFFQHSEYGIAAVYPTAATRNQGNALIPLAKLVTPLMTIELDQSATNSFPKTLVADADAEATWEAMVESAGETVKRNYTMIVGTLLPIYDRLPDDTPEVYRVTLDDGERLIGRVISEAHRVGTLNRLGLETKPDPDRAFALVKTGQQIKLANGFMLKTSRVNAVPRIEVLVPAHQVANERYRMASRGLIVETIDYRVRFFIPTGAKEDDVLRNILDTYPLAS